MKKRFYMPFLILAVVWIFIRFMPRFATQEEPDFTIAFKTDTLQFTAAPVLEEDCTAIKTIVFDGMNFELYQLPEDTNTYLSVTLAGTCYDLGAVGYFGTNIETFANTMIQDTQITASNPIYELTRNESFDILSATYFMIQDDIPVILYTIPGKNALQYDVDQDGQMETTANCGLSTNPDYWLYEWDIAAGKIHAANLRTQLNCDTLFFDEQKSIFIAGWKEENQWREVSYQYQGGGLKEISSVYRTMGGTGD